MGKKFLILSSYDTTKAYTTLIYLTKSLERYGESTLITNIATPDPVLIEKISFINIHEPLKVKIPFIRISTFSIKLFFTEIFSKRIIILNDLYFLPVVVLLKKINKNRKIVFYSTEYFDESFKPLPSFLLSVYQKYSDIFDLVIDCDPLRLELRKHDYKITDNSTYIYNTVPLKLVNNNMVQKTSLKNFVGFESNDKPILIYSGGASLNRNLSFLIDAIAHVQSNISFVAFCYGSNEDIHRLDEYCKSRLGKNVSFKINSAIDKNTLLAFTKQADVGLCYYNPDESTNNKYAAPSKVFEYIGCGIPVVCSNNPTMKHLFEAYEIGVVARDNTSESLGEAIELIIANKELRTKMKQNTKNAFENNLCFEVSSKCAIDRIINL